MDKGSINFRISNQLLHSVRGSYSRPIVRLSIAGIALSIVIMILSVAITSGYRQALSQKIVDMGAHIRISNLAINYSYEPVPFDRNLDFINELKRQPEIKNLHCYYTKVGIAKTDDQVEGIVLKGVENNFFNDGFKTHLVEGSVPDLDSADTPSNQIVISAHIAKKLQLHVGDNLRVYFVQDPPRQRKFIIRGIYETGLPEYDESFILTDLRQIQKLNGVDSNQIGGIEIVINHFDKTEETAAFVNAIVGNDLKAEPIQQIYPELFDWMDMFSTNVWVLLTITFVVCLVTIISTFFIIILEQISAIGLLKTMGMRNSNIRTIFLWIVGKVVFKGLVYGNVIAFLLCFLQSRFRFIHLSAESYYIDYVPILIQWQSVLGINLGVFLLCLLAIVLPASIVAKRISPVKAVRFE